MYRSVFLTGATGFLGTNIMLNLMKHTQAKVYVLIRAQSQERARMRLLNLWWDMAMLRDNIGLRIIPVIGDITIPGLGIKKAVQDEIITEINYVIHAAAEVRLNSSREHLWRINVEGTRHVLAFAEYINNHHKLERFSHVSTAYVAGLQKGLIYEDSMYHEAGFGSLYEQSKYEAELLARNAEIKLPISIFRPGQIIGDSQTGQISSFNTIYYPLKLFLNHKLKILPMKKSQKINMVPVDYVAKAIVILTMKERAAGKTFHLTAPRQMQPTVYTLLQEVRNWAANNLDSSPAMPLFISLPLLGKLGALCNMRHDNSARRKNILSNILLLTPYFFEERDYDTQNVEALLGSYTIKWQEYIKPILTYATRKGFLNHNERTVFEQLRFQLSRKKLPLRYYDVTNDGIKEIQSTVFNETVERVIAAFQSMDIRFGDRVAIAGTNSTKYLILDSAIGLAGAVSVPIYYTAPAQEIDLILEKSGAKIFLVGDYRILSKIAELKSNIPIITFNTEDDAVSQQSRIVLWEEFLSRGRGTGEIIPVSYGDTATIRYTSGTTGNPKGVMFNHYQLRWMGEILSSLLSWQGRNTRIRYLSFLPMSHVVEGILATYAPYYLPGKAEIYFLNDFNKLVETLPKIRPTVFFSVPRFYEKLWDGFSSTKTAQFYLEMKDGRIKYMLAVILKKVLLKKAGLNKCSQLISGSAPISNELIQSFRELGIEIHNAYGLTEAPLVALNKLGDNEIGTVGELLPDTLIKLDADGEILVKGPQVTCGYDVDVEASNTFDNEGFFRTGDFGNLSASNKLIISGRKKEILVTSYGKNINPLKIETMIKNISGIAEAMVVGEGLPYCTLLLWIEQEGKDSVDTANIDKDIISINERLSNPEKIKKWAVISRALSINQGELTPNLKLRKNNIIKNYKHIITCFYKEKEIVDSAVIHLGRTV